jgi:2-polyprenyl-6-methoxyphenol hydroxylase-like FAD-dependent oxidoreductase
MPKIVVLGAGVVGLTTAMLLAEDGHDVTMLERDPMEPTGSPEAAWADWERRGVGQFRLPHGFLARFRAILDAELPHVARSLETAGARRFNPLLEAPEELRGAARPEDARFEMLTGRRPVVEWVVGAAAQATPRIEIRRGVAVEGLLTGSQPRRGVVHVVGVRTGAGDLRADLVLDVMGRRSPLPRLLEEVGARAPHEELEDSGLMYFARHFRSQDHTMPVLFGPVLQDVGSLSTLTIPCDNDTWGVVLASSSGDKALYGLRDVERWSAVMRSLPFVAHWLDGEPLDDHVTTISKIEDRIRTFVIDDEPIVTGIVSVGDAWACSNPTRGRGASIGAVHGLLLRDLLRDVGLDDPAEFATAFHGATDEQVRPWFDWTLHEDRNRLAEIDAEIRGVEYRPSDERFELERALGAASGKDPDLLRTSIAAALVVERLDDALADDATVARIRHLGSNWRDESTPGPGRDDLVKLVNG